MKKLEASNLKNSKKSEFIYKFLTIFALGLFAIPMVLSASVLLLGLYLELHSAFLIIMITFIFIEILWFYALILGRKKENDEPNAT